jgi:uncharacterized membrane protein required for colicin V production
MRFSWYDAIVLVPLLAIVIFEMRQEFGRGLLDTLAALIALYLAASWAAPAAPTLFLSADPSRNVAYSFLVLFGILLLLCCLASRFLHKMVFQISVDQFDPFFGLVFGLAVAVIIGHSVTSGLYGCYPSATPAYLSNSLLANELLSLRSLREIVGQLQHVVQN